MSKIAFIGAGNMARSILGGLVQQGFSAAEITAADPNDAALAALQADFGIHTTHDNKAATHAADVVVLAVKPQVMGEVCRPLADAIEPGTLIISIAAGINCHSLQTWLGADAPQNVAVVRCMPNTPSLVRAGASGLYATPRVTEGQKALAESIMQAVGTVQWVNEEALIDAVTAVSGSGPAYFFYMLEAMTASGVKLGLDEPTAQALAIQTAAGAAKLAASSDVPLAELRRRVCSPGGTTEQAIASFETNGFANNVESAMQACFNRAVTLANELGEPDA